MNHRRLALPADQSTHVPRARHEIDVEHIMHELKDQVCILGLGIAALKRAAEDERERYLEALQGVVGEMNLQFQRFEDWRSKYRPRPPSSRSLAGSGVQRHARIAEKADQESNYLERRAPYLSEHPK